MEPWGRVASEDGGGPTTGGFLAGSHTTLSVVATDLSLSRPDLGRVARMAAAALPRAISPVNTPFDGDIVFVVSTGERVEHVPPEELLGVGVLARDLLEESIRRAVSVDFRGASPDAGVNP